MGWNKFGENEMKTFLFLIFTFFFITIINGCDLISKSSQGKNKTTNTKIEIKYESNGNTKKTNWEKYIKYVIDASGPTIALIGILITFPLLRKKLTENHITNALNEIQRTNINVLKNNHELIDLYLPNTYIGRRLSKKETEKLLADIKKAFYLSQSGSSDVMTILFYLKSTIQNLLKNFNSRPERLVTAIDVYALAINTLEIVNFYCTQVAQIPKSGETINLDIINKKIVKYTSHNEYKKYKYFRQGVIHDANSSHFTLFYNKVLKCSCPLILRAAFQIYCSPAPVLKEMYLFGIYAPTELVTIEEKPSPLGLKNRKVYLIGIKFQTELTPRKSREVVDLIYSNPDDIHLFANHLNFDQLKNSFKDSFIHDSQFDIKEARKMNHLCKETFKLQYTKCYLENCFQNNKRKIEKAMKKS